MKIDLHCHTSMSDGSVGVRNVIRLAKEQGIHVLAITDHDTFAAGNLGVRIGREQGIQVLSGAEISAYDNARNRKVHILCYCPREPAALRTLLQKTIACRRAAMAQSVEVVQRLYPVPAEMILKKARGAASIYKQHIMAALTDAGYADGIFGTVFHRLFNAKTGAAYRRVDYPDVFAVLAAVRQARGIAVLAHPGQYHSLELMESLCQKNLISGMELHHPRNSEEAKAEILRCAQKYKKICTGGTDFHGAYTKTPMPVGTYLTEPAQFTKLEKLLCGNQN